MYPLVGRGNEALEQRVRLMRLALKLRVKLAGNKEWMLRQFDDLYQFTIRGMAAEKEFCLTEFLPIGVVKLVTMPMPLVYHECAV